MQQDRVEVDDGVRLRVHRAGSGTPAVVCLSAGGGAHEEWAAMVAALSPCVEIVTYGRPGLGGSDPLPAHLAGRRQTIAWAAAQLRTLLHNAGIGGPWVLLTSSIGSWIADQYTALWPDEVAGLVLVDPTNPSPWPQIGPEPAFVDGPDDSGGIRLDWDDSYAELARSVPPASPRRVVVSSSDGRWERRATPAPWHHPLTLAEVDQLWQAAQREWVTRLDALHVVADTAGHFVHCEQPDLVTHVVRAVLDAARHAEPVKLTATDVAAVGGRHRPPPS